MNVKDQSGAVLPLTLVIIVVLTLLGIALLTYSLAETKQVAMDEDSMKAHYIARTGAHGVALYLIESTDSAVALINSPESGPVDFADGQFKVEVSGDPGDEVYIKSTGTVGDAVQTITVTLREVGVDFALYGGTINVSGQSARISGGDVVYGETAVIADIVLDGAELIKFPRNFDSVILPCEDPESDFFGLCPSMNDPYNGEKITEDSRYGEIKLGGQLKHLVIEPVAGENLLFKADTINLGNNNMTVKLNDNTVAIVVDDFINGGNGEFYIQGNGCLMLYVKNYGGNGSFQLDPDSDVNVNVFVLEEGKFDLSGTLNFEGAIYAPHAETVVVGNCTVTGWVIAGDAELGGNVRLYYKPILLGQTGLDLTFYRLDKWRYDNY